jgi:hypothetical protein
MDAVGNAVKFSKGNMVQWLNAQTVKLDKVSKS